MGWHILRNLSAAMLACLAIGACAGMSRQTAKPITKIEARSLPSDILVRRTLDQLADILSTTVSDSEGVRPRNVLTFLWLNAIPRATDVPGLCQHDALIVDFGHAAKYAVDSDTPVRAVGLSASSYFLVLDPSQIGSWEATKAEQTELSNERCAELSTEDPRFFEAKSARDARDAFFVLMRATSELKSGTHDFKIDCGDKTQDCVDLLKKFRVEDVSSVSSCTQIGDPGQCWSIQSGFYRSVEIATEYAGGQNRIASVKTKERVVLIHGLID
jgi:hypothetical protein